MGKLRSSAADCIFLFTKGGTAILDDIYNRYGRQRDAITAKTGIYTRQQNPETIFICDSGHINSDPITVVEKVSAIKIQLHLLTLTYSADT